MPPSRTLQVSLPEDAHEFVQEKVSSGEYSSASEVLLSGIELLREEEEGRARWERDVLVPSIQRFDADPQSAIPLEQVVRNLEERRRKREPSA